MNYIKPLFRIDRRPIVKINCANILNDTNSDMDSIGIPEELVDKSD